jgi:hypothetical protein
MGQPNWIPLVEVREVYWWPAVLAEGAQRATTVLCHDTLALVPITASGSAFPTGTRALITMAC